ncbi:hypothetical protein [Cloacibacillus evryensis]|uniref:hypothetical protein n=1 Tax=Cloacibacillus evryensis TaxID=508460 RepID=UPI002B20784B|nr:hypothetical protein [Cloacibacillus evryensis]MEA5034223.1 hypothetical protein [Cloacibacillus evryensis]
MKEIFCILLGTLLGGAVSIYQAYETRRKETVSLASAFLGEITTILKTIEMRNYTNIFEERKTLIENNTLAVSDQPLFSINMEIAFPMYRTRIQDIGFLPPDLTKELILFYGYVFALLEDMINSPRLYLNQAKINANEDPEAIKSSYYKMWLNTCNNDICILQIAKEAGNNVKNGLDYFIKENKENFFLKYKIHILILIIIIIFLSFFCYLSDYHKI